MENIPETKICKLDVYTFSGRGTTPIQVNHSPNKIQKARRITVTTPPLRGIFSVYSYITRLEHESVATAIPTLSKIHTRKHPTQQMKLYCDIIPEGQEYESTFYLGVIPIKVNVNNPNDKYKITISLHCYTTGTEYFLHSFIFSPVKTHNFEISEKGRKQNEKNADTLNIPLLLLENLNLSIDIE